MISKRLKQISLLVPKNKRIIDVGCDHGLLGIYLYLNNSNEVILSDISLSCINKSSNNLKKYNLENKISLIQSNGLENIPLKKEDIIIIAGMGTNTILQILNKNIYNDLIIQTNNNYDILRKKIIEKKYYIENEVFFIDKGIEYIVICFKKGKKKYSKIDLMVGPYLKKDKHYIKKLKFKYNNLLSKIPKKYFLKRLRKKQILKKIS